MKSFSFPRGKFTASKFMSALVPEHWKLLFDNLFALCHAELGFHLPS